MSFSVDRIVPNTLAGNPESGRSEVVTSRIPAELVVRMDSLLRHLEPRFKTRSDLVRTALLVFLDQIADEVGDELTKSIIFHERTAIETAYKSEQFKAVRDTVHRLENGIGSLVDNKEYEEAQEYLIEFKSSVTSMTERRMNQYLRALSNSDKLTSAVSRIERNSTLKQGVETFRKMWESVARL